jgi:hypothetical protein
MSRSKIEGGKIRLAEKTGVLVTMKCIPLAYQKITGSISIEVCRCRLVRNIQIA